MTEQLMENLTNEEHEALLLMSEHGIAAPLSPAAQAVLDACERARDAALDEDDMLGLAAALRALVGANAYEVEGEGWYSLVIDVDDIYAIAAELEGL
jgi:hypothetical protein